MTFIEKLKMIERIDQLIRMKATGNAKELAGRLGVSERCIYDLIKTMKIFGAPILYSSFRNCYYYDSKIGKFHFGFVISEDTKISKMKGGKNYFYDFFKKNVLLHDSCGGRV